MMKFSEFKVFVKCMTFNQARYITDTMNGFVIQKTDFPFLCAIVDDASKDGEQEVIINYIKENFDIESLQDETEYGYITFAQHKTNRNCYFGVLLLKENHYTRWALKESYIQQWHKNVSYIAICEGDDYWIDPMKLQKQVDILDSNSKYIFCHTGFKIFEEATNGFIESSDIIQRNSKAYDNNKQIMEDILDATQYRIQTMTTLIRLSAYPKVYEILKAYEGKYLMEDTQKWLALLSLGDVYFISDITSVYRVNIGSACRPKSIQSKRRFALSCAEMRVEMAELFDLSDRLKRKLQSQYQKILNLYLAYDPNYKIFVPIKYNNYFEYLRFKILKLPIVRDLLRIIYSSIR